MYEVVHLLIYNPKTTICCLLPQIIQFFSKIFIPFEASHLPTTLLYLPKPLFYTEVVFPVFVYLHLSYELMVSTKTFSCYLKV